MRTLVKKKNHIYNNSFIQPVRAQAAGGGGQIFTDVHTIPRIKYNTNSDWSSSKSSSDLHPPEKRAELHLTYGGRLEEGGTGRVIPSEAVEIIQCVLHAAVGLTDSTKKGKSSSRSWKRADIRGRSST